MLLPLLSLLALAACRDEDLPPDVGELEPESAKQESAEPPTVSGPTILGRRTPNAYTPEAMRRALAELSQTNKSLSLDTADIEATHLYLRFAPRDSSDVMALEADTSIFFTEVPMDYEVAAIGDYYRDPSLPDTVPTYMYCTARVGQSLPDVPHETLSELFLMEEANVYEDAEALAANKRSDLLWEQLEAKSRELAGLDADDEQPANKSKWTPGGVLKYEESDGKVKAIEGVPVRIHRGFVTHQCCTDAKGVFSFSRRRHHVRYYIKWRRDCFHIRGLGKVVKVAETTLADNSKSRIERTITDNGHAAWKYASVFRPAHYYFYHYDKCGLSRPDENNLIIRLSAREPDDRVSRYFCGGGFILPDVFVYYRKLSSSRDIFRSTIHEIAHCAHHKWSRSTYRHCDKIVKESWARGIAYYVAREVDYGDVGERFSSIYTGLVLSLTRDDFENSVKTSEGTVKYHLKKFTLSEVERCLKGCTTWNQWRDKLKNTENGKGQENEIDKVFDAWAKYDGGK